MSATTHRIIPFALLLATSVACHRGPPPRSPPTSTLAGDWTLVELDSQPAPAGAAGRSTTIRFETDSARVTGFAGCNRFAGSYVLAGDSLRFGEAAMTKMACAEGMELERRFTDALAATTRFRITGADLILIGGSGTVARFTRARP